MSTSNRTLRWLGQTISIVAAVFITACTNDGPVGPEGGTAFRAPVATVDSNALAIQAVAPDERRIDLAGCDSLQVPANTRLVAALYAKGVQIYRWNGTAWSFVAPSADLFLTQLALVRVATHYAGPTWESIGGSKVVAAVAKRCTPNANAIPWLLLDAVSNEGPGIFQNVTHIQRLKTTGGLAPSNAGSVVGEEARVPYIAEYRFYRDW